MILGLLYKLINFALLSLAEFDHFDTFPGWVGGAKLRLKTNSAQLKLKLGLSLAKSHETCPALNNAHTYCAMI